MKKVFAKTFGCTLNQKKSEEILKKAKIENKIENADYIFVNTCGVKEQTENKIVKYIRSFKKLKIPERNILIYGCLVNINKEVLKKTLPKARFFYVGEEEKIHKLLDDKKKENIFNKISEKIIISDGCLGNCSYCAVKFARGHLKSKTIEEILSEINKAIEFGAKEILLTSQDTGCYGFDIDKTIIDLLNEILKINKDFKIRLGMANPKFLLIFYKKLIPIFKNKKMYKFIHIPVQSGDAEILKKMRRDYSPKDFIFLTNYFRKKIKNINIATDVIVGFPTETKKQFLNTVNIIKKTKPDIVNISRFGRRKNIEANKYPDLKGSIKKERSRIMTKICNEISFKQNKKYLNKIKEITIIKKGKKNTYIGITNEYKQVILNEKTKIGKRLKVKIVDIKKHYLIGKIMKT